MKKTSKKIKIDTHEVDAMVKKVKRLRKLLKKANSLADELASKDLFKVDVKFQIN